MPWLYSRLPVASFWHVFGMLSGEKKEEEKKEEIKRLVRPVVQGIKTISSVEFKMWEELMMQECTAPWKQFAVEPGASQHVAHAGSMCLYVF
jgi:hypothetical protein